MKRNVIVIVLMALLISGATELMAQNFNFIGAGARARGMGGAFIGVADDATAISWNPAGLATLERMEGSAVGFFASRKSTLEIELGNQSESASFTQNHPAFNFGSLAVPLVASGRNLVIAGAYQRLIDLYYKYESEYDSTVTEYTGGIDVISPGAAIQFTPEIAVGASFNIWTGGQDYKFEDKNNSNNNMDEKNINKFSGFNVNIGVLAHKNQFKAGAVMKTPLTLTNKYKSGTKEIKDKYKFPLTFGFGVSVAPNENLTLAADVDIRQYSKTEYEYDVEDTTVSAEFENTTQIRVGMEYLVITESSIFPIRLGWHSEPYIENPLEALNPSTD
ncbi:MAG: conjugal transfer protein TraF, partial [candidate division Zixibacteria bacterium]|nr:conjugal transfer protein TraF [candidate division Zixibacteria bacterium]